MTQEKLTQTNCPISTLYAEDSLVKAFQSLEKGGGFDDARGTLFFEIARIAAVKKPKYLLLENVPGLYHITGAGRLRPSLVRWMNWGTMSYGKCLTAQILVYPNPEKKCILSDFIEKSVPEKYCLSQTQIPKTLVKKNFRQRGNRVYSADGLSITLTSQAGGFGGKTGLYEIIGLPIKSKTNSS